ADGNGSGFRRKLAAHEGGQFGNDRHGSGQRGNARVAGQSFLAGAFLFSSVIRPSLKSMAGAE
ncbi:MAG: hypothetical protein ACK56I_24255, partial [bacterium]